MLRDLARLAPTSHGINEATRDVSNIFPIRRTVLEFHQNPRAMAAIERAQNTRIRRPHLVDDAGNAWMPVRPGIQFAPTDRLVANLTYTYGSVPTYHLPALADDE